MDYNTLINALRAAETAEKQGLPAVGLMDYARKPWGEMRVGNPQAATWTKYKETELDNNKRTNKRTKYGKYFGVGGELA